MKQDDLDDLENKYDHPFNKELDEYADAYEKYLGSKLSKSTVSKHLSVIYFFNQYISSWYSLANGFEDLTVTNAGSKFAQYYESHHQEGLSTFAIRNILYGFFLFIYEKYGIVNHNFLIKLKPKRVR